MADQNSPTVAGSVNADQLQEYVDSRINSKQRPDEVLADDLSEYISIPEPEQGLTKEDVRDMIEESGGDSTSPDTDLSTQIQNVKLTNSPKHTASIQTGVPEEEYHPYGNWGVIVTVDQPVHWRSTVVVPEEAGQTNLEIYNMDYSEGETYEPTGIHATREINHGSGQQKIYPDVILPEGQFFITRDPDQSIAMREIDTDVDWSEFNQHNVPITVECSWRINADYRPGTDEFDRYQSNNWDQLYYYFGNPKFGFQSDQ